MPSPLTVTGTGPAPLTVAGARVLGDLPLDLGDAGAGRVGRRRCSTSTVGACVYQPDGTPVVASSGPAESTCTMLRLPAGVVADVVDDLGLQRVRAVGGDVEHVAVGDRRLGAAVELVDDVRDAGLVARVGAGQA